MLRCSHCQSVATLRSAFCARCGAPLSSSSAETVAIANAAAARLKASSTPDEGLFPPGVVLGQRYRIASRLGKGGMGEVYKATDLLVGEAVALKFLPDSLSADTATLERFRNEVRLARQVSHRNVCRVFDLGEAEGQLFLSMEFIDGEDLASLLRRIGYLPDVKALEIARNLCAGLAAAHDRGVLHRDLKPSNIMIDGRGRVLITDFGLAVAAADPTHPDVRSGTPAYMSPEQAKGVEVTTRSDVYSLGVVLYEMFTGAHPFASGDRETTPPAMRRVDPAVERVVLSCLNADPRSRPATAAVVAATLPGGDPLAAALAAGETPSPELVAASGPRAAVNPGTALVCFIAFLAGIVVLAWVSGRAWVFSGVAEKPPDVMMEKAREILVRLGYPQQGQFVDGAYGYGGFSNPPARTTGSSDTASPIYFWRRSSPRRMVPSHVNAHVQKTDPPVIVPGMTLVQLDPQGRLRYLRTVPGSQALGPAAEWDWKRLFESAGLDVSRFDAVAPIKVPEAVFDQNGAWIERGDARPLRVEAASWRGKPVWFAVWFDAARGDAGPGLDELRTDPRAAAVSAVFRIFLIAATGLFAFRNVRSGRADVRGAFRVGCLTGGIEGLASWSQQTYGLDSFAPAQFDSILLNAMWAALITISAYLAFEPFVRKRWPDVLISWTRALQGAFKDPLVGRDLLLGLSAGIWLVVILKTDLFLGPNGFTVGVDLYWKDRFTQYAVRAIYVYPPILTACAIVLLLVIAAQLVRRWQFAVCSVAVLIASIAAVGSDAPLITGRCSSRCIYWG